MAFLAGKRSWLAGALIVVVLSLVLRTFELAGEFRTIETRGLDKCTLLRSDDNGGSMSSTDPASRDPVLFGRTCLILK